MFINILKTYFIKIVGIKSYIIVLELMKDFLQENKLII